MYNACNLRICCSKHWRFISLDDVETAHKDIPYHKCPVATTIIIINFARPEKFKKETSSKLKKNHRNKMTEREREREKTVLLTKGHITIAC